MVVILLYGKPNEKNISYNLLDIVAKNFIIIHLYEHTNGEFGSSGR